MAIEKTFMMECDRCRRNLEDSDGLVTGSGDYLREKADCAGWEKKPDGWCCGFCIAALDSAQKGERR